MNRRLNPPGEERSNLANDVEFLRFLEQRKADAQRECDRLQSEIETHLEQVTAKRQEQGEYMTIVEACAAGLGVTDRSNRPAPTLTQREPDPPVLDQAAAAAIIAGTAEEPE